MGDSMVNWYYVVGSERVGPVSVAALQVLFTNGEITTDTYVWKKGFVNWERLRDVAELKFDTPIEESAAVIESAPLPSQKKVETILENIVEDKFELKAPVKKETPKAEPKEITREINLAQFRAEEKGSPEVKFSFDWSTVNPNEELFFVKIGKDRRHSADDIYGPYSMVELKEALAEKRVNLHTLVYSAGMSSWTKLQDTPINDEYIGISLSGISLSEIPLIMVFDASPLPLVTIVKKAGVKEAVLLGAGPFADFQDKTVKASLYVGSEIKAKNVQVKVQSYDKKDQAIECQFIDLDSDAKKIMLNHAV